MPSDDVTRMSEEGGLGQTLALSTLVVAPGAGLVQKYAGLWGVCVLFAVTIGLVATLRRALLVRSPWVSERTAGVLLVGLMIVATAGYFAFNAHYPQWNARVDRDEALDYAVREALAGRYPYSVRTQLGGPISPLPGALLLAAPWVVIGTSRYQMFFWLGLGALLLVRVLGARATLACCVLLFACPAFSQEWTFAGDLFSNTAYVAISCALLAQAVEDDRSWPHLSALAVFVGIAIASRAHLALVAIPLFALMLRRTDPRSAAMLACITVITAVGVTLPFYVYSPSLFSPLHAVSMLSVRSAPSSAWYLTSATLIATLALAPWSSSLRRLFGIACGVHSIPLLGRVALDSLESGHLDFLFLKERHGISVLVFGLLAALWPRGRSGDPRRSRRAAWVSARSV